HGQPGCKQGATADSPCLQQLSARPASLAGGGGSNQKPAAQQGLSRKLLCAAQTICGQGNTFRCMATCGTRTAGGVCTNFTANTGTHRPALARAGGEICATQRQNNCAYLGSARAATGCEPSTTENTAGALS